MKRATVLTIGWLAMAATIAVGIGQINIPTLVKLVKRGAPASATFLKKNCGHHSTASYTFAVGTARYSGTDVMPGHCRALRPGDRISIYYDVSDPALSRANEPWAALTNEIIFVTLASLMVPTFIVGIILLRNRR
jgi:hypothetical protein